MSGYINDRWIINAGYTYVDTKRPGKDRIWTNLPEHSVQLSTHYDFSGVLEPLILGGGINWQGEIVGFRVTHPLLTSGATFEQGSYTLANLYATWHFDDSWTATLSATNLFNKTYCASIDYANYGEPRNISFTVKWKY